MKAVDSIWVEPAKTPQQVLRNYLGRVHNTWHHCALQKRERGMRAGTLCDSCREGIEALIQNILGEMQELAFPEEDR